MALERDGEIIATSKDSEGIEDLSSYYVESSEWKTEVVLYEKHSLIKEAYRGDNLRVMKTTEVKTDGTDEGNDSVLKKKGSLDSVLKNKVSVEKKGSLFFLISDVPTRTRGGKNSVFPASPGKNLVRFNSTRTETDAHQNLCCFKFPATNKQHPHYLHSKSRDSRTNLLLESN